MREETNRFEEGIFFFSLLFLFLFLLQSPFSNPPPPSYSFPSFRVTPCVSLCLSVTLEYVGVCAIVIPLLDYPLAKIILYFVCSICYVGALVNFFFLFKLFPFFSLSSFISFPFPFFSFLSFPFLSFPFLSLPFFSILALRFCHCSHRPRSCPPQCRCHRTWYPSSLLFSSLLFSSLLFSSLLFSSLLSLLFLSPPLSPPLTSFLLSISIENKRKRNSSKRRKMV